jgi:hypothetical protein
MPVVIFGGDFRPFSAQTAKDRTSRERRMKLSEIPRMLVLLLIALHPGIATAASPDSRFTPAPLISKNGQLRGIVLLSGKYEQPAPLTVVKEPQLLWSNGA